MAIKLEGKDRWTMTKDSYEFDWRLRHAVYRHFASTGSAPSVEELAEGTGESVPEVEATLHRLADKHHALALAPGTSNIWMAWPFSAVPTAYPVKTAKRTYWANCAWDALSIPGLVGLDAHTSYNCPDCLEEINLSVIDGLLSPTDSVVHFAVPPRRFYDNVAFT